MEVLEQDRTDATLGFLVSPSSEISCLFKADSCTPATSPFLTTLRTAWVAGVTNLQTQH